MNLMYIILQISTAFDTYLREYTFVKFLHKIKQWHPNRQKNIPSGTQSKEDVLMSDLFMIRFRISNDFIVKYSLIHSPRFVTKI